MALKESNKNRRKPAQSAIEQAELEQQATCSYITRIIFTGLAVLGTVVFLVNEFIFPNL